MDTANAIVISFNLALAIYILAGSLTYFLKVKTRWRWIKLCYAMNAFLFVILYMNSIFHWFPLDLIFQRLTHTLMLSTLAAGLLVSQAKLAYANHMNKVAEVEINRAVAWVERMNGEAK
jgi:hypothetical protein